MDATPLGYASAHTTCEGAPGATPPGALAARLLARYRPAPGRIIMPDVCCDLVWSRGVWWLAGPQTLATPSQNVDQDVVLMQLDPLVARAWLRTPLAQFTDRTLPLADVSPRLAHLLEEHHEARTIQTLVRRPGDVTQAGVDSRLVISVRALRCGAPVAAVAEAVGLSERQFERVFSENLGLSPKAFTRIARFRRAVGAAKSGSSLNVAAAEAGYADQSHFSREARKLADRSPRALLPYVGNVQDFIVSCV